MAYARIREIFQSSTFVAGAALISTVLLAAPPTQAQEATDDCQVMTEENGRAKTPDDKTVVDPHAADNIDDCNGVLKPPVVGDRDLVQPAPNVGDTPVLPPAEVPQQAPSE